MNQRQKEVVVISLTAFSFLPIWRIAGGYDGMNIWQYINAVILTRAGPEYYPHVTVEEAIENARRAYCEVKGLDYEESYSDHFVSGAAPTLACRA